MRTALLILSALLTAPLAHAAPVVLYGPGLDAASAAAEAAEWLDTGDFRVAGPAGDLVPGADVELVAQGLQLSRCPAEVGDLGSVLSVARAQVLEMEFESAEGALQTAASGLPCGAADATREQLFELFFLQGLAAFNGGREDEARAGFAAAASVSSTQPWPARYPPTAKGLYLESLQAALQSRATVLDTDLTELRVDGEVAETRRGVPLLAGRHVLRHGDDVALATAASEGGNGRITTAGTLRMWLDTGAPEAGPWLAHWAQEQGWTRVVLLYDGRVLELIEGQLVEQARRAPPAAGPQVRDVGFVLVGVGAGTLSVGVAANVESYRDADVRLVEQHPDGGGPPRPWGLPEGVTDLRTAYEEAVALNRIGLGLAVGGGGLTVAGALVAVISSITPTVTTLSQAPPAVVPTLAPVEGGAVLGLSGRF